MIQFKKFVDSKMCAKFMTLLELPMYFTQLENTVSFFSYISDGYSLNVSRYIDLNTLPKQSTGTVLARGGQAQR